ncbi:MAG: hypothetical protein QXL67_04060 [Candidatus Bathyarchaeia archaeon]
MPKATILYDSKTGNNERLAKAIAEGIRSAGGVDVVMRKFLLCFRFNRDDAAEFIIPFTTYYG